ncbi:MAG: site-specific integrase [Actinomycetota bacterium]|nr:site-specific integrase [Actinomycetota bacterium]
MSRRGSVKKAPNGTWFFVVDLPGVGDKRQQVRRRGFATRGEAQAALTELLASLQHGTFVKRADLTLGQYLADWTEALPASGRGVATVSSYRHNLRLHVTPYIGGIRLQDLAAVDLDRLYRKLLTSGRRKGTGGLSNRTVRYVHTILSAALADAVAKGLLPRNPAQKATPPSAKSARAPEMAWWSPAELRGFLQFSAGHPLAPLFRVAGATGMRRGELLGLNWRDVDLDAARLTVRRQVTSTDYVVREDEPKSERGRRVITLDPGTVAALRTLPHREGVVFVDDQGQPFHPEFVPRAFSRLVRRSGLPRIRFHDLRHSHVAHLIEAGVDPLTISRRIGHASVAFTLDRYGHLFDQAGATAARAVGDLLGDGGGGDRPDPSGGS